MATEMTQTKTFRGKEPEAAADSWLQGYENLGWTCTKYTANHMRSGLKVTAVFTRGTWMERLDSQASQAEGD